jgi:hypothetical protein
VATYLSFFDMTERRRVRVVRSLLTGPASAMIIAEDQDCTMTMAKLNEFLRKRYVQTVNRSNLLTMTVQRADESVIAFANRVRGAAVYNRMGESSYSSKVESNSLHCFKRNSRLNTS